MGRGGGGGSSHHSSHHSSSHSHSGGSSYRSSGSSYSHHSSSSSYRSHRYGSYGGGSGSGGGGCSFIFGLGFIIIMILGFGYAAGAEFIKGPVQYFLIERSTTQREALPSSKCQPVDTWFRDDWGDWINDKGEETAMVNGLKHFYEKTGVQPYVWIMGEEGKDYMSEGSLEELGDNKYKEMFGNDEGHLILIFREYPNESSNYVVTVTPGNDAWTLVIDEEAKEILLDFIDYYYTDDGLNEGQFFGKAFEQAGDRIMMKQLSFRQLGTIIAVALIVVIGLIIVANIVKKRKIAVAKQKTLQKQASAQEAKAVADQKKTDFDRKQYEDQLETQFVAVECPNCGSSGNKIRRATVGYCPFCGTAIKVDQDGNVSYMDRDNTAT